VDKSILLKPRDAAAARELFNTGDELAKGLRHFAAEQNLADGSFRAIGALASVKLP
jgi:hypothetical protein